jgi:hypothetical protein
MKDRKIEFARFHVAAQVQGRVFSSLGSERDKCEMAPTAVGIYVTGLVGKDVLIPWGNVHFAIFEDESEELPLEETEEAPEAEEAKEEPKAEEKPAKAKSKKSE